VELREFVAVIRAHLVLVGASALVVAAVVLAVSLVLPPSYVATTELLIGPSLSTSNHDPTQLQAASDMATTYAIALQTRATAQAVIKQLGLDMTIDQLHSIYSVSVAASAPVVTISASSRTPEQAAAIAGALAQHIVDLTAAATKQDESLSTTVAAQIASVEALLTTTQARISQLSAVSTRTPAQQAELDQEVTQAAQLQATLAQLLNTSAGSSYNMVTIIDPATPPSDKASPKPLLYSGLGLVLGALGGVALAFAMPSRNHEAAP
jgi:capsular polysaccharide biosynthesis protein